MRRCIRFLWKIAFFISHQDGNSNKRYKDEVHLIFKIYISKLLGYLMGIRAHICCSFIVTRIDYTNTFHYTPMYVLMNDVWVHLFSTKIKFRKTFLRKWTTNVALWHACARILYTWIFASPIKSVGVLILGMELMIKCLLPMSSWANHYLESKHTYINDEGIKVIVLIPSRPPKRNW